MLSVVIPTFNAETALRSSLSALQRGLGALGTSQIIVADGGSTDASAQIAQQAGADIVRCEKGRGNQLAAGARRARGDWLLFIHADTQLEEGWHECVKAFVRAGDDKAAVFKFKLDDESFLARCLEGIVALRTSWFALPYGDQGLLISRQFYEQLGGFRDIPIMEDVDIIRRIGKSRFRVLPVNAVTSADRYRRDGYLRRMARNILCLSMWFSGIAPERIVRMYR